MSKTSLTSSPSHASSPAIRLMWKSKPLRRMLRMSKVPIAGHPCLSPKANGVMPLPCMSSMSDMRSSLVSGGAQPFFSKMDFR